MNTKHIKLILISFICLFTLPALAQEKIKEGKVTVNNRVYSVSKNSKHNATRFWIQYNVEFIQKGGNDPKSYARIDYELATKETIISAVEKVLERSRIAELAANQYNSLSVSVYPDYTGRIKAMFFIIPIDHPITMEEIDRISFSIEKNVSFKVSEPLKPGQRISPFSQ